MSANNDNVFDCTELWKPQQFSSIKIPGKTQNHVSHNLSISIGVEYFDPWGPGSLCHKKMSQAGWSKCIGSLATCKDLTLTCLSCCAGGTWSFWLWCACARPTCSAHCTCRWWAASWAASTRWDVYWPGPETSGACWQDTHAAAPAPAAAARWSCSCWTSPPETWLSHCGEESVEDLACWISYRLS